ncbi:TPA: hypothetical protein DDW35_12910 [Candidatus Sumerlaeota bacterium]|jgi:methyl-accepting chemotaxis protein|nr:hypothetical protein [Candidatus Sumerlaeota bacterium]
MRMTIQKKLMGIGFLAIFLPVTIFAINKIAAHYTEKTFILREASVNINATISDARIAEKAYMQFYDAKYVAGLDKTTSGTLALVGGLTANKDTVTSLTALVQQYEKTFHEVVALRMESEKIGAEISGIVDKTGKDLDKVVQALRVRSNELMMDGERLSANEANLQMASGEAQLLFLRLALAYQQSSASGNNDAIVAFEQFQKQYAGGTLAAFNGFTQKMGNAEYIEIAKGLAPGLTRGAVLLKQKSVGLLKERDLSKQLDEIGKNLNQSADSLLDSATQQKEHVGQIADWMGMAITGAGIILLSVGILLLGRSITRSLVEALEALGRIARRVTQTSTNISDASQELAQSSQEQSSHVDMSVASLKQLAAHATSNAEKTSLVASISEKVHTGAEKTGKAITRTVQVMQDLNASSQKVSGIIKTIEVIAFQTNLLALNAAVEAARAGEHGKGFAVVAGEVRNLAGQASMAAKDTALLLETNVEQANMGVRVVQDADREVHAILEVTDSILKASREVRQASEEQSTGIAQINTVIAEIDQATSRVASEAEEAASSGEELSALAQQLYSVVQSLNEMAGGHLKSEINQDVLLLEDKNVS